MTVESLRAREQARYMPDACTVQRANETSDGMGGTTQTWTDHLVGLPCRVERAASVGEDVEGGQVVAEADVVVTVPHGTDVTAEDRIVTGGRTLEIDGVLPWSYQANLKVACRE